MSPNRQEMRNDALSRIGLPTIPVQPTSQVSEWNDDETTLVTSASLSWSTFSIDETLVDDYDYDHHHPNYLFREELDEFINTHFGNHRDRGSRDLRNRLHTVEAFGTVDLDANLQGENPQERRTSSRGSRVYH